MNIINNKKIFYKIKCNQLTKKNILDRKGFIIKKKIIYRFINFNNVINKKKLRFIYRKHFLKYKFLFLKKFKQVFKSLKVNKFKKTFKVKKLKKVIKFLSKKFKKIRYRFKLRKKRFYKFKKKHKKFRLINLHAKYKVKCFLNKFILKLKLKKKKLIIKKKKN